jgi:hypothetical protein
MHPMAHPEPGDRPPRRRLERAPGERYVDVDAADAPDSAGGGRPTAPPRGIALAAGAAAVGAAATVVLAGVFAVSLGLLVVAFATGWLVANALIAGSAATIAASRRRWAAVAIAVVGIVLGQLGVWLYARAEGGALGVLDYLWQTFGWIIPAQLAAAAGAAWWTSR